MKNIISIYASFFIIAFTILQTGCSKTRNPLEVIQQAQNQYHEFKFTKGPSKSDIEQRSKIFDTRITYTEKGAFLNVDLGNHDNYVFHFNRDETMVKNYYEYTGFSIVLSGRYNEDDVKKLIQFIKNNSKTQLDFTRKETVPGEHQAGGYKAIDYESKTGKLITFTDVANFNNLSHPPLSYPLVEEGINFHLVIDDNPFKQNILMINWSMPNFDLEAK